MPTALSTDLYELTMAAGYHAHGLSGQASFELWVRELPPARGFLVASGLDQALAYLETLRFEAAEIAYLRSVPALRAAPASFFDEWLPQFRFRGDVWAVAEGTPIFAGEPILRVRAPLPDAQIVETALLSTVLFQTAIASKAARVVEAAGGRPVIEFGSRRAQGSEAGVLAARAAVVAGCAATSNVAAGYRFGAPLSGTMAHSWVMTHEGELEAFRHYAEVYGDGAVLLIDTYDPIEAARGIVRNGLKPAGVRLDSGDLTDLSRRVRAILDDGGLTGTEIIASGDLDEGRVAALVAVGAPIDRFGVGTALSTSSDAPALGGVYKLVEVERGGVAAPTIKLSQGKRFHPGPKQIWRRLVDGVAAGDLLGTSREAHPNGLIGLLEPVMHQGRRLGPCPVLLDLQSRCRQAVGQLPAGVRRLREPAPYPVSISESLKTLTAATAAEAGRRDG